MKKKVKEIKEEVSIKKVKGIVQKKVKSKGIVGSGTRKRTVKQTRSSYYIDPKVLTVELTKLAKSYRAEVQELIKEGKALPQFKDDINDLIVTYTSGKLRKKDIKELVKEKLDENGEVKKGKNTRGASEEFKASIHKVLKGMTGTIPTKLELRAVSKAVTLEKLTVDCGKKAKGDCSEDLGLMFLKIVDGIGNKKNFINYTYKEEMKGLGTEFLCKYGKKFDFNHPKANAFSYLSQICSHGFVQCITKEKKQSEMKDKLIKRSMETSEQDKWIRSNDSRFSIEKDD
jgi:hypothetical protein